MMQRLNLLRFMKALDKPVASHEINAVGPLIKNLKLCVSDIKGLESMTRLAINNR